MLLPFCGATGETEGWGDCFLRFLTNTQLDTDTLGRNPQNE